MGSSTLLRRHQGDPYGVGILSRRERDGARDPKVRRSERTSQALRVRSRHVLCQLGKSSERCSRVAADISCSPLVGGWWERLIGVVKRCCKKTLQNASLSFSELQTVLAELEDRVNRRPLVFDKGQSLSPSHFLHGVEPPPLQAGRPDEFSVESSPEVLTRKWQHRMMVSEHLWNRFRHEYLQSLRAWRRHSVKEPKLSVGDVVLVSPPDGVRVPRSLWPLGLVLRLFAGRDGKVRAAELRVRGRVTSRPVSRLYPLECATPTAGDPGASAQGLPFQGAASDPVPSGASSAPIQLSFQPVPLNPPSQTFPRTTTRSGRTVSVPRRFEK